MCKYCCFDEYSEIWGHEDCDGHKVCESTDWRNNTQTQVYLVTDREEQGQHVMWPRDDPMTGVDSNDGWNPLQRVIEFLS